MKRYPLLQSQLGIFLEYRKNPESTMYNLPIVTRLSAEVDLNRLEKALQTIIHTRDVLRSRFAVDEDGKVYQWSAPDMEIPIVRRTMSKSALDAYLDKGFIRAFDLLGGDPIIRFEIIETENDPYLLLDSHHVIYDGTTHSIFFEHDLPAAYEGDTLPEICGNIYNAALDEEKTFATQEYIEGKEYYSHLWKDATFTTLPDANENARDDNHMKLACGQTIADAELIDNWCKEQGIKPYYLFQGAFSIVLSRMSREKNIAYTSIHNGRFTKDVQNAYGMFVRNIPVLEKLNEDDIVIDFIRSLRNDLHSYRKYAAYPATHFFHDLRLGRGISFNYVGEYTGKGICIIGGKSYTFTSLKNKDYAGELHLDVSRIGGEYKICTEGGDLMYRTETLQTISNAVIATVTNIMASPEAKLKEIAIVDEAERNALISLGTGENIEYDKNETVVDLFKRNVKNLPDVIAVMDDEGVFSYDELDRRSDILAAKLIQYGISANEFVAIRLPRTKDFIMSVLGIWKAGCAYVPIDPEYPEGRIAYMLEDCKARISIDMAFLSNIDFARIVTWENRAVPDGLAYMIYTSGSTGKPKGVMVSHANARAFCAWRANLCRLCPGDRIAHCISFSFDASMDDLLTPIATGATIFIAGETVRKDPDLLSEFLRKEQIVGLSLPAQMGMALINEYPDLPLKYIMMGGEKLRQTKPTTIRIINEYGPTEFTVCSSYHIVRQDIDGDNIPIGRPVPNSISIVTDSTGNLLPRGVMGELCLIGRQMSQGYWNAPEKTSEKFIDSRLPSKEKMYRTGDLVRWDTNGKLLYCGRVDFQVKLRGFRIEPGEIESAMEKFSGILAAAAEVKVVNGIQILTGYYEANEDINTDYLQTELSKTLPGYMVPAVFVRMKRLPLTPNGKVDRKALPVPDLKAGDIVEGNTDFERIALEIVKRELGVQEIGVTTNLISMGMTSIGAIRIAAAIKKGTGRTIRIAHMLSKPFIREWSKYVDDISYENKKEKMPTQKYYPLTANQLGIYLDWEQDRTAIRYNVPLAMKFWDVDARALLSAVCKTVENHPYLKVHLEKRNGEIVQVRRDEAKLNIIFRELDKEPNAGFFQSRVCPFDLLHDDLARIEVYGFEKHAYLFSDIHHIINDGSSLNILLNDIAKAYEGKDLETEMVSAYDNALYCDDWKKSKEYRSAEMYFADLLGETESMIYPSINADAIASGIFATCSIDLERKEIQRHCRKVGITENAFFATVLCQVFHRITREETIQIATISSGRGREGIQNSMGMFVQTLPLVSRTSKGDVNGVLRSMQEQITGLIQHELYPYTEMVEKYNLKPNMIYVYQDGVFDSEQKKLKCETIPLTLGSVKVPLSLNLQTDENNYHLVFEYDAGLYTEPEMNNLLTAIKTFALNLQENDGSADISTIPLISKKDRETLIRLGSGDLVEYNQKETIVDLFHLQKEKHPDAIAVADDTGEYTYAELDKRSDILAAELIRKCISTNEFVAIKLPRIKDFVTAILGIWKAGGAYVPIDLEYPEERIEYMLTDSDAKIVIDQTFLDGIDFNHIEDPTNRSVPDGLAYMIYTSGSTGKPKGVMISHANVRAFCAWRANLCGLVPHDRIAHCISFSFDASLDDLAIPITTGASIFIASETIRKDPRLLSGFLKDKRITGLALPAQLGTALIDTYPDLPLKFMIMGGEKLKPTKPTSIKIINEYGPTEFTVCSSYHVVKQDADGNDIPIGRPAANSISVIIDSKGNLLPRGMIGELCLIGRQMARGYLHATELTSKKFTDVSFLPGEKMYRTGDLARWNKDGELQFSGRADFQVKLRGFRIEMGEIESILAKQSGIRAAVATIKTIQDIQYLIGYYEAQAELDTKFLKSELAKTLPDYMIPAVLIHMEHLPLTPNGKVNMKELPTPSVQLVTEPYTKPENEMESIICEVYGTLLHITKYGTTWNFFASGGTSLLGFRAAAELQRRGLDVVYGDLFKYKSPKDLAGFIMSPDKRNTSPQFDYGNYDYKAIDNLLREPRDTRKQVFETRPIGNVLLTGATGYLGMHILNYLLENTDGQIYLLVRGINSQASANRLEKYYRYYFKKSIPEEYSKRIVCEVGDIANEELCKRLNRFQYDTLINCAALVKHYTTDDAIDRINVKGVRNLIECCKESGAVFVHVSTYSIGGSIPMAQERKLDEFSLYIGQTSENDYVRTKFLAERYLLEAMAQGQVRAKIMRLGNLMGRESDGEFQINVRDNAFVNMLRSFYILGVFPQNLRSFQIEMSPIDKVAEAIVKLAGTPYNMPIFHVYNPYRLNMEILLKTINDYVGHVEYVSDAEYQTRFKAMREDPKKAGELQGILHYGAHSQTERKLAEPINDRTTDILRQLGFQWKEPDEIYLKKFINALKENQTFQQFPNSDNIIKR